MSATLSTLVPPSAMNGLGASRRIFSASLEGITRYFAHRAAMASLRELDDSELRDMGLTRSQIEAAVRGFMTTQDRSRI